MKKAFIALLAAYLLFAFTGCAEKEMQEPYASTSSTTATTTQNTVDTQNVSVSLPMVSVSLPVISESEKAQDGTVLFSYIRQNISLIVPEPEVADKIIVDFLNRTDIHDTAASFRDQAQSAYTASTAYWTPYLVQILYQPMRIDSGVISMYGGYSSYNGASHAETVYQSVSYDLVTGEALTLEDILTADADKQTLCQYVLDALKEISDNTTLYEGYESTVKERFGNGFLQQTDWYFSGTGLCFFFSPYEIGPYSSGDIVAEVSYEKLPGILADAYFPAERENVSGSVNCEAFDKKDLDKYRQFAEIVLHEDGQKVLLYPENAVYDIRLEIGSWSADGSVFTPEHTILAAHALTPGDGIMVQWDSFGTIPVLRLSYTTDNRTVYRYITSDGCLSES